MHSKREPTLRQMLGSMKFSFKKDVRGNTDGSFGHAWGCAHWQWWEIPVGFSRDRAGHTGKSVMMCNGACHDMLHENAPTGFATTRGRTLHSRRS